ncbi:MAG: biotin--[acetyl-CoA-carboxylase] ligase [Gallionellaceae bacterium]|nr:biotin--[acetyl-CoA-carboxylase] ligase [Gallionellaceae bacterium]
MNPSLVKTQTRFFALLRLLVNGDFYSGPQLAQRLGISRASVSNALQQAEDYGLKLYRVRGRGYCLSNPPQWLDAALIIHHLGHQARQFNLEIIDSASSTNTLLLQRAAQGAPSGSVLAVEWQSGGRGRLGRAWHSSLGNALTFSLLWRFERGLSSLSGLSLAVGVALIRVLSALGIHSAQLKWPNDVLGTSGKLAGILIEAQGDMLGPSAVVIGVGLNLFMPPALQSQIDQPVSSVADMMDGKAMPKRNYLLALILLELQKILHTFVAQGFSALRTEWESHHALQQQAVQLLLPDGSSIEGVAQGTNQDGALVLETTSGTHIFHAGEVSLRPR